jgi:hypothetical protein
MDGMEALNPPSTGTDPNTAANQWASDWTESQWIRLLPDANALLLAWPLTEDGRRSIAVTTNAGNITGGSVPLWKAPFAVERQKDALMSSGDPSFDFNRFSYGLLITRMVEDTSGQLREVYVAVLLGDTTGNFSLCQGETWQRSRCFRVEARSLPKMFKHA